MTDRAFAAARTALLAVLVTASGVFAGQPGTDSCGIRIMTWNIRYNNPDDGLYAWPMRRSDLAGYIQGQRVEILCVQEALHDQVFFMKDHLRGFDYRGVGRDDGAERGEYSAIFFDARRFRAIAHGTFWLSTTPSVPGKGWDAALPRIVTWVRLQDSLSRSMFFVFNTHFDHQGVLAREESARLMRKRIGEIAGRNTVIAGGDFNANEDEIPYKLMTSPGLGPPQLYDSKVRSRTAHRGPTATFTGFPPKTPDPGETIDFLFVTEDVQVINHVTGHAQNANGFLSDHLPVMIDIAVRAAP